AEHWHVGKHHPVWVQSVAVVLPTLVGLLDDGAKGAEAEGGLADAGDHPRALLDGITRSEAVVVSPGQSEPGGATVELAARVGQLDLQSHKVAAVWSGDDR